MKLFLDTNALLDLVLDRTFGGEAMRGLVSAAHAGNCTLTTASLSLKDLSYVIVESPMAKTLMPSRPQRAKAAADARELVFDTCEICDVDELICRRAHANHEEPDYDGALIAECALVNGADVLVSRDKKAFNWLEIPKLSPVDALKLVRAASR